MKAYRLKHIPTGLYFQPHKHRGSHLSKTGKIYQTNSNGLSYSLNYGENKKFTIRCEYGSSIYKQTSSILKWSTPGKTYFGVLSGQVHTDTLLTDWLKEEIN